MNPLDGYNLLAGNRKSSRLNQSWSSFCDCIGNCLCVCLGSSGESEHCLLNINTNPLSPRWFPLLLILISTVFSFGSAAPVLLSCLCFPPPYIYCIKSCPLSTSEAQPEFLCCWAFVNSLHTHQVGCFWGRGRMSLLFAGGELADLAGCGDSFTWGVGRGGGSALSFGLAVQRPRLCPVHTNWLG